MLSIQYDFHARLLTYELLHKAALNAVRHSREDDAMR